jgi:hypothetical protein
MKVTPKEKELIQKTFTKYRAAGFCKEESLRRTAKDVDRGRTTVWDNVEELDSPKTEKESINYKPSYPKTLIFTGWEIRVGVDNKFVQTLKNMADYYNAELFITPCTESDVRYMPKELSDNFTVVTEDLVLNSNLRFKYIETSALLQSPLAGHVGMYPDSSTIVPGLVKELRSEPSQHYIKQLMSVGSVGHLNARAKDYDEFDDDGFVKKWKAVGTRRKGKASAIAQNFVVPSALIIDIIDNKTFLTRFVTSYKNGVVYDLNRKFTPEGIETHSPSALLVGDVHAWEVEYSALNATKEMIRELQPKEVILGDFFDGASCNHHEIGDQITFANAPSIREEADVTIALLKEFCDISNKVVYLQSNHDDFLLSYLKYGDRMWRLNRNYEISCGLQFYCAQTREHPIVKLLEFNKFDNLKFVRDYENHYVGRTIVKHGHEGASGVRVGFMGMARIYNYYAQGHVHAPAVYRNALCVGLISKLFQGYNKGASAWGHANGIFHPDGSSQLLNIIRGTWKNED